ncbi:MAG: MarR family transcriptional regulator [Chloroflexi bacterium]|nr:MarR family transcriptional regulator [Chloroflexota bacterium]
MKTLAEKITSILEDQPGLSDREITDILVGPGAPQQAVNQSCRSLETRGILDRHKRSDGRIGNYLLVPDFQGKLHGKTGANIDKGSHLSEDKIKTILEQWLKEKGWHTEIAWGRAQGIDIEAFRGGRRWIIEVKGQGSRSPMRVNYFLAVLGETLQRMGDPGAKYSIAIPDMKQFRNLWRRLPKLAKARTAISALFVSDNGNITEID